jgi:hypothetical protein
MSYEFAYHQLGDPGKAGMYSYFSMKCMQSAAYQEALRKYLKSIMST